MSLPFLDIILFLAAVQGVFLAALIFHKYGHLFANRFLSAYMFLFSIIFINLIMGDLGIYMKIPYLLFSHVGVPFLIGPLHYLYAKNLIYPTNKFNIRWLFHLIPFVMFEILFIIQYAINKEQIVPSLDSYNSEISIVYIIFNWAIIIQGLLYMFSTLVVLNKYSRNIKEIFSSIEKYQLNWLRNITLILTFVIGSFLFENALLLVDINLSHFFSMTSYLAGFAINLVGYLGLLKSEVFSRPECIESFHQVSENDLTGSMKEGVTERLEKYAKSGLSPEKAKGYLDDLIIIMEKENLYTDANLTLNQLADKIGVSAHYLSEVINTQQNKNFFDFINQYRVEKVKKDLADPAKNNLKILSLAFEAGFNSKASFNTIFKKLTGMTPSEYRTKILSTN